MKQTLERFKIKVDENGKELKEPNILNPPVECLSLKNAGKNEVGINYTTFRKYKEQYQNAREVIVLPSLSEFEKAIDMFFDTMTLEGLSNYYEANHWYRLFITQPLTEGMFVPCDEEGNVLKRPKKPSPLTDVSYKCFDDLRTEYQQAKERVIFEGEFTIKGNYIIFKDERPAQTHFFGEDTIEQAINNGVELIYKG
jgi:hypothetical protein